MPGMGRAAARPDRRPRPAGTGSDVALVVAAATAPGTFASSLSPRSALDQGLVTGLATGLHFLLSVEAQDALAATVRALADGAPSPARRRARTIAVDCAAVPLGLAVLRALPARPADPLRGLVRQAAWRLGATGLCGAVLTGAETGVQALDDRLRLAGRLSAVPLAVPVGLGVAYAVDRVGAGRGEEQAVAEEGAGAPPPPPSPPLPAGRRGRRSPRSARPPRPPSGPSPSRPGWSRPSAAAPTANASWSTWPPVAWPWCCPGPPSSGSWPATPASCSGWGPAPPRCGT